MIRNVTTTVAPTGSWTLCKRILWVMFLATIFCLAPVLFAQTWTYKFARVMRFNVADTVVISPYLCTVDSSGNLWVTSSRVNNPRALNALFKAAPSDSVLHLVLAFADSDSVRDVTGITSKGNDIFVVARVDTGSSGGYFYPYSEMFYLPNGNPGKRVVFKQPQTSDYGTWYGGLDCSKDGYLYFGQSYLSTIGTIDGRKNLSQFGSTIGYAHIDWSTPMEPGGGFTSPDFIDLIRSVAVYPDSNYGNNTNAVVFTSRNSGIDGSGSVVQTGGIAAWIGGDGSNPLGYSAVRIMDQLGFLRLGTYPPYGIAIQPKTGYLFVCGTDSTRRWVKGFQIMGTFAVQVGELPSSTSQDKSTVDTSGAPFIAPADVAFNSDGLIAYVTDTDAKRVYVFETNTGTYVHENADNVPLRFELCQNFPNPFNPGTAITVRFKSSTQAKVVVYNSLGQVVKILANARFVPGTHNFYFDGTNLTSGMYFCRVLSDNGAKSIKMLLLK